jgi:MraZ protein
LQSDRTDANINSSGLKWSEVEAEAQSGAAVPVEAPRGTLSSRVDEKGRLKLPAAMAQYLEAIGERKVFITTLDLETALIYPISVWRETEKMLQEAGEDADMRADVAFVANHYGEDGEMDAQGRVLLPTNLRRELNLEKDDVSLLFYKQRIEVIGSNVYKVRFDKARSGLAEKVSALQKKGMR